MFTLPPEFSEQISSFAPVFHTKKVFEHAVLLLTGAILCTGRRTVSTVLQILGLSTDRRYHKYHRVLNRSTWSAKRGSFILLQQLLKRWIDQSQPLVFALDSTLERRWGRRIKARGIYHDPVRSSKGCFVKASGLRWLSMMLVVRIPWANRQWALPFFTVLAPSKRYHQNQNKRHKKLTDWARQMILQLRRWLPKANIIVVADAGFAVLDLLNLIREQVDFITRLRMDAALYEAPPPRPKGKRGPRRKIGPKMTKLSELLSEPNTKWENVVFSNWYGRTEQVMQLFTGTALWYKGGKGPVPLRWVLIRDPKKEYKPIAIACTNLELSALDITAHYISRWSCEVTFEEARAHLGIETQRQWSDLAILRTTPCLLASFSIITIWADLLNQQHKILLQQSTWYQKTHPTFSDAIASVRYEIYGLGKFSTSRLKVKTLKIPWIFFKHLTLVIARAA